MTTAAMRRIHSATGLLPLGAYLLFHAWEHWPVRDGRDALFARLRETACAPLELLLVVLPLLLHAVLGVRLRGLPDVTGSYASPAFRALQLWSGVLSALFIGDHLVTAWLPRVLDPSSVGAAYGALVEHSGTLLGLAWHALGIAAVCTHLGQGMGAALIRAWPGRLDPRVFRSLGVVLGVLLWLVFLNELASYATYAPLL